jgi:hypothetical protein
MDIDMQHGKGHAAWRTRTCSMVMDMDMGTGMDMAIEVGMGMDIQYYWTGELDHFHTLIS